MLGVNPMTGQSVWVEERKRLAQLAEAEKSTIDLVDGYALLQTKKQKQIPKSAGARLQMKKQKRIPKSAGARFPKARKAEDAKCDFFENEKFQKQSTCSTQNKKINKYVRLYRLP